MNNVHFGYVDKKTASSVSSWQTIRPVATLDGLKKHVKRYGWDKKKNGWGKMVDIEYKSWRQMKVDTVVKVALYTLTATEVYSLLKTMTKNRKVLDQAHAELFEEEE